MIIMGIDPGTAVTGYGVIEAGSNTVAWKDCGTIETDAGAPLPERLERIDAAIEQYLTKYKPERVAIEQAFYAKNVHTTLLLGHARGVLMLAARKSGARVAEYTPREIKKAVTGSGSAEKSQVEYMVRVLLSPPAASMPSDAYDALAAALCDFYHAGERSIASAEAARRSSKRAGA